MTMSTPILGPVPSAAPGTATTAPPAGSDAGDAFLALVLGLLDETSGQAAATAPPMPEVPADATATDSAPDAALDSATADTATEAAAAGLVVAPMVPPLVQVAVTTAVVPAAVEPAAPPSDGSPLPLAAEIPAGTATPAPVRADIGDPGTDPDPAASAPAPPAPPEPVAGTAPESSTTPVPTAGAAAPVASTPTAPTAPTDIHRIGRQVFSEVVRVVADPDGPRRVTVRLDPESLGEVRVVLTSRRGGLDVSLAGGAEARRALAEGAPELQRLLEAIGRGDARITVRDLAGVPVPATALAPVVQPPTAATGLSADLAGGSGTSTGSGTGPSGGEAGTQEDPRGSSTAMDGTPAPTAPSRRTETVTGVRTGLDVTM
ncbi:MULTISPECIES: flagellar hook-length control protein FliK [unclassified Nocardioides]|uniref:flagellar hook-length control protein FliK n=1 Tax=unclassified Nocardioides TaxID=2615069 RepID=UPI0009EFEC4B|nr:MULTISPECIES: flagellar hook-length control protein FliK [unclassified Nocardioides]GAW51218.1 hypothetical protein PD653B2_3559 [Nocardioides sp. PD653-B2]GAW56946.1 hypothetical protein PD653_4388 [Nocardioides sp. PD653]